MRAFKDSQADIFLKAFGQTITTSMGTTFTAIVEASPFSIETGGGYVQGVESYFTVKQSEMLPHKIAIGSVITVSGANYVVYNIVDDLSGMVDVYYRTEEGQSFVEDY